MLVTNLRQRGSSSLQCRKEASDDSHEDRPAELRQEAHAANGADTQRLAVVP